jgi:hypothetical protein
MPNHAKFFFFEAKFAAVHDIRITFPSRSIWQNVM